MKHRTQFSNYKGHPGKKPTGVSLTVPDLTVSIQELLLNHTRGLGTMVNEREGMYLDTEIPKITDLNDLAEHRHRLIEQQKEIDEIILKERASKIKNDKDENEKNVLTDDLQPHTDTNPPQPNPKPQTQKTTP